MHIDVKALKNNAYRNFVSEHLKKTQFIIISMIDDGVPSFEWESVPIPQTIDFHAIAISSNERLYCYRNNYYDMCTVLKMYISMKEFFEVSNIYRLMFASHDKITIECMYDEVIMYNI